MPVSDRDFVHQVQSEVDFLYEGYSYIKRTKEWAFAQWALEMIFPTLDPDEAFNLLAGPEDASSPVHAGYKDEDSGTYYLLCVRYNLDPQKARNGPGVLYSVLDFMKRVIGSTESPAHASKSTIAGRAAQAVLEGYTLSTVLVLFGTLDASVDVTSQREEYAFSEQQLLVYDVNALRRLAAGMDQEQDKTSVELALVESSRHKGPVEALFGSVAASELRRAFEPLGPEIYDVNVRTPLGLRTRINKQMRQTIESPTDRRFFWYYNNGITVLCRGFREVRGAAGRFVIDSPRIVNGAQTTQAILSDALPHGGTESAAVSVRFIAALPGSTQVSEELRKNPQKLQDLYLNIAKYTNSQNPIEIPDFRSNEEIQQRLHEKFAQLGWFYEHRRGLWENHSGNKKKFKKDGVFQRLTMIDLAQEWFAFDGHPATAIRERLSLFEEQGHYSNIFLLSRSAEEYLVAHLLFQQLQLRIKANIRDARVELERAAETGTSASMEAQNYLAIGRATKLAVAHLSALLGKAITARLGRFNAQIARALLPAVESGQVVDELYSELEDAVFRAILEISGDKHRTVHQYLSEAAAADRLNEFFNYALAREERKGRSPLHVLDMRQDHS